MFVGLEIDGVDLEIAFVFVQNALKWQIWNYYGWSEQSNDHLVVFPFIF